MKKVIRILVAFVLALSLTMLASCRDDNSNNNNNDADKPSLIPGGVEGPIIPLD